MTQAWSFSGDVAHVQQLYWELQLGSPSWGRPTLPSTLSNAPALCPESPVSAQAAQVSVSWDRTWMFPPSDTATQKRLHTPTSSPPQRAGHPHRLRSSHALSGTFIGIRLLPGAFALLQCDVIYGDIPQVACSSNSLKNNLGVRKRRENTGLRRQPCAQLLPLSSLAMWVQF